MSEATDGFGPGRPRSRGRGGRSGPAVCGKRQVKWIKRFSHFVKTRVAARFRRVESLFPSFELLRRDIVTRDTINQNVGPDQRDNHDGAKRTNESVAVISLVNLRLHFVSCGKSTVPSSPVAKIGERKDGCAGALVSEKSLIAPGELGQKAYG